MKMRNKHILAILYIVFTLIIVLLWIPVPEIYHFFGASSIISAFLFAVGADRSLLAYLALIWIPLFIISLLISFIYALKRGKYSPFFIVVACDLLVSMLIIGGKIKTHNYSDLGIALTGYFVRLGYFFWMLCFSRNMQKTGDGSQF